MREIELTKGHKAIVDDEDYERASAFKWYAKTPLKGKYAYAARGMGRGKPQVFLHRFIVDAPPGLVVDHINGNTLDNRRANLRVCTQAENARNRSKSKSLSCTSKFKGVSFVEATGTWKATISVNGFKSEEAAAKFYDEVARKYVGEFAKTNF